MFDDTSLERTRAHLLSIKDEYFEQDQWYRALVFAGLEHLTFPSRFVDVTIEEASSLLSGVSTCESLVAKIDSAQQSLGAERIFVKFVRSPKDSSMVYDASARCLLEMLRSRSACSIWQLFGESRQEALGVESAEDAVALLRSSGRVCAAQGSDSTPEGGDLWWSVHGERFGDEFSFDQMRPRLMVREFRGALPLHSEWRAFIWDGRCTAISQYFFDFCFEELQGENVRNRLLTDLQPCLKLLAPIWKDLPSGNAMLDFAWQPKNPRPITIIEINPFDPERGLGHTSSLALFDWAEDCDRIRGGEGTEVRVTSLRSESQQEKDVNRGWATVGSSARDVMRGALQQLSSEELESSHAVTRIIARKLGVRPLHQGKSTGNGKAKGKG
eukprot:TRINITY_DN7231_c0_g3_i1.p1 TRINITY_DN7231_c0_g3~~TRINITY_DN7231_c0_g3_i1.p1  ORF type:complete len:401 (+),score=40.66 TRINITY_DN7231_c0_g3_i1:50-1204(+)